MLQCLCACAEDIQGRIDTDRKLRERARELPATPAYSLDPSGLNWELTPSLGGIRTGAKGRAAAVMEGAAPPLADGEVSDEERPRRSAAPKNPREAMNNLSVVAIIVALYFFVRYVMRLVLDSKALHVALLATLSVVGTSYALPGAVAAFLAVREAALRRVRALLAEILVDEGAATPPASASATRASSPGSGDTILERTTPGSTGSGLDDAPREKPAADRQGPEAGEGVDSASLSRWNEGEDGFHESDSRGGEGEAGDDDGTARASGVRAWNGDDGGPYFKNTVRKLRYDADVLGFNMAAFGALVEDEAASIWSLGRPSVAVGKPPARRRAGN